MRTRSDPQSVQGVKSPEYEDRMQCEAEEVNAGLDDQEAPVENPVQRVMLSC